MIRRFLLIVPLAITMFMATLATDAHATLLAYEPFNNDAGSGHSLLGEGGGTGFSGTWTGVVNGSGLSHVNPIPGTVYPANAPLTSIGGSVQINSPVTGYTNQIAARQMSSSINLGANGVYYFSFIARTYAANPDAEAGFGLASGTTASDTKISMGWAYTDKFAITVGNATQMGHQSTNYAETATRAGNINYFVAGMIVANAAGNDEIYLKAFNAATDLIPGNPAALSGVGAGATQWSTMATITSSAVLNRLALNMAGTSYPSLDEFRLGTSWYSVTGFVPEPSSLSMLSISILGLWLHRRRKSA